MKLEEMEAGREMDALVAKKVMGWTPHIFGNYPWQMCPPGENANVRLVPRYSTDIAAAWEAVEILYSANIPIKMNNQIPVELGKKWRVEVNYHDYIWADTLPLAICRAVLLYAQVVEERENEI